MEDFLFLEENSSKFSFFGLINTIFTRIFKLILNLINKKTKTIIKISQNQDKWPRMSFYLDQTVALVLRGSNAKPPELEITSNGKLSSISEIEKEEIMGRFEKWLEDCFERFF